MEITRFEGHVRVKLTEEEAVELAVFLSPFYEGTKHIADILSEKLDEVVGPDNVYGHH